MLESKFALIGILAKGKTLFETSVASIQIWLRGARTRTQVAAARAAEGAHRAEAKAAEDERRAAEAKAAEDARRAAEAKAAEDARRAKAKAAEDARRAAEAKAAEDERRAAEAKAAEDAVGALWVVSSALPTYPVVNMSTGRVAHPKPLKRTDPTGQIVRYLNRTYRSATDTLVPRWPFVKAVSLIRFVIAFPSCATPTRGGGNGRG
jgi:hypothetical protein